MKITFIIVLLLVWYTGFISKLYLLCCDYKYVIVIQIVYVYFDKHIVYSDLEGCRELLKLNIITATNTTDRFAL